MKTDVQKTSCRTEAFGMFAGPVRRPETPPPLGGGAVDRRDQPAGRRGRWYPRGEVREALMGPAHARTGGQSVPAARLRGGLRIRFSGPGVRGRRKRIPRTRATVRPRRSAVIVGGRGGARRGRSGKPHRTRGRSFSSVEFPSGAGFRVSTGECFGGRRVGPNRDAAWPTPR